MTAASHVAATTDSAKNLSVETHRAHSRLLRECEAFRVELGFLERRSLRPDNFWAIAAHEQLNNVLRCLESDDIEGGWFGLHAAQRYAVFGMNQIELVNRAHVLREESLKINSWRADAMESLLSVLKINFPPRMWPTPLPCAMKISATSTSMPRIIGDRLRILLIICGLAAVASAPFIFLPGRTPMVAAVLFFGLLGSAVCSAQSLIAGRSEAAASNLFITLTPVLFGALAGLGGFAVYEYMPSLTFHSGDRHISAVMGLAFFLDAWDNDCSPIWAVDENEKPPNAEHDFGNWPAMRRAISFILSSDERY